MILTGYFVIYLYISMLLLIAYVLNKQFKVRLIITRKFVHIMVSFTWLLLYYFMDSTIHILIPPLSFIALNYISYKRNIFKGIEDRESLGTVYYPISVFIMALVTFYKPDFYIAFGIGTFCMGIGDGFAPLVAGYLKSRQLINSKTITGTVTVFAITFAIVLTFMYFFNLDFNIYKLIIIATSAALIELIGVNGLDNLYLPLGVSAITYLLGVV